MKAQTSKKQYQAIAPVSRFDLRSSVGAQTKAIDPVQRFRWALSFQGISHAAGKVLAALADHADQRKLTCFPAISNINARNAGVRARRPVCLAEIGGRWSDPNRAIPWPLKQPVSVDGSPQPGRFCPVLPGKDCPPQPGKDCPPNRAIF